MRGGIYLNLFELVDFLAGWAKLDPAGDDGKLKALSAASGACSA